MGEGKAYWQQTIGEKKGKCVSLYSFLEERTMDRSKFIYGSAALWLLPCSWSKLGHNWWEKPENVKA